MKVANILAGFALGLLVATSTAQADDKKDTVEADAKKDTIEASTSKDTAGAKVKTSSAAGFSYRPPMRGAPASRIGGGTRGIGDKTLELVVLAPDHTGLTTREQPTLYWYASEPVLAKLEVTLINDESIDPKLEQIVATPGKAGIHSFDLAKTNTRLKPGMEYRWFVSAIADMDQRSNDIVASGTIQRIKPNDSLTSKIAGADKQTLANVYAEEGVWYDTIDALSRSIEKSPGDSALQEQRSVLLEQVGLQAAADYTRAHKQ